MKIARYASATEITLANGTTVLVSYSTPVAAFVPGKSGALVADYLQSRTTAKHVTQFMSRNGLTVRNVVTLADIAALLPEGV